MATKEKRLYVVMLTLCALAGLAPGILDRFLPGYISYWVSGLLLLIAIPVSIAYRKERRKNRPQSL